MKLPDDDIAWVRQVNGRWIVRESLRDDAEAFLEHLDSDPDRLREACRRARLLVERQRGRDPKPWFYAGLFSVASAEEARRFLGGHNFTLACLPSHAAVGLRGLRAEELREDTKEKTREIRNAVLDLEESLDEARHQGEARKCFGSPSKPGA